MGPIFFTFWRREKSFSIVEIRTPGSPVRSLLIILTRLSWLYNVNISYHRIYTSNSVYIYIYIYIYIGRFITFYVITNIYNKKTKEPTLLELFTATGKLKKFFLCVAST